MIRIENPYTAQRDDAGANAESIQEDYGAAALAELQTVLMLQHHAFRYGARVQLEACMADLRTWAAAYAARSAEMGGGDGQPWTQVADEVRTFARDWMSEAESTAK